VFWGSFAQREPKIFAKGVAEMFSWMAEGKLKPRISKTYKLEEAAQALVDMSERKVTGKIVVIP